jgi:hypothetical protein
VNKKPTGETSVPVAIPPQSVPTPTDSAGQTASPSTTSPKSKMKAEPVPPQYVVHAITHRHPNFLFITCRNVFTLWTRSYIDSHTLSRSKVSSIIQAFPSTSDFEHEDEQEISPLRYIAEELLFED